MLRTCREELICLVIVIAAAVSVAGAPAAKRLATLQSVTVTSTGNGLSIEISANQPVTLRSQLIADPDRLILDFPNAQPASDLRTKLLNQGDVKGYRVARYSENPPTTRVVIDLNSPQHYQIFPDGKTVIVKLMSDQQQAAVRAHLDSVAYKPEPAKPVSTMQVQYNSGRLSIAASGASLADVLNEVHRQTGTDIPIPPGAAQERIVTNIGPLPIREALVSLLNGSRFNFIMVDSENEPGKLKSVILTYRGAGGLSQPVATPDAPAADNAPEPEQPMPQDPQPEMQPPPEPQPPQEGQGQPEAPQPQDAQPPQ